MGIDIWVRWDTQTQEEMYKQNTPFTGYLRESYGGNGIHPCYHLLAEAFEFGDNTEIPYKTLEERLPETLRMAEERCQDFGGGLRFNTDGTVEIIPPKPPTEEEIKSYQNHYTEFVEFCKKKEIEQDKPVTFYISA